MLGYQREFSPAPLVEDYYLEGQKSLFSIVVPEATENLVINPSPVTNTTGYSAMAGAIASSTTRQRRGPNSIRVAPTAATTDGAYYGTVTTVTGWNTFSLDFWGYPGVPYKIYFATTGAGLLGTAVEFVGEGLWRRPEVRLYETAGTTRRVYFTKNGSADTNYFYVDGLQVEAKDHSTTFCMGDMVGYVPGQAAYYWTGAYYGSTSVRIADTGSGGKVVPLSDYGFKLTAHTGLGMSDAVNISFPYARIDGENYQTTRMAGRDFSLMGVLSGSNLPDLMRNKASIIRDTHPDRTQTRQPMLMLYQFVDEYGGNLSEDIYQLKCVYVDGLKGSVTNKNQERLGLNFRMANPDMFLDGVSGTSLSYQASVTNTAFAAARIAGLWQALGTGFSSSVTVIRVDKVRGRIWFGGSFATANGITVNKVCYWDMLTQNFVAVGGATKGVSPGIVYGLEICPNGDVWVFGTFTSAGGSATKGIARWNTATDTFTVFNLAGTVTGFYGGALDQNGLLYTWGLFTDWNGDAAQDYVTSYTAAGVWTALGTIPYPITEVPDSGNGGAIDAQGNLILGSNGGGGGGSGHLRRWNVATSDWSDLGATNANKAINAVHIGSDGMIYVGGSFSSIAGITLQVAAKYNGTTFTAIGDILGSGSTMVVDIDSGDDGIIWLKGYFQIPVLAGTTFLTLAGWNGSSWILSDIVTQDNSAIGAGSVIVYNGNIYMGWSGETGTTSTASAVTTVTSTSRKGDFPIVKITGPTTAGTSCKLVWLENQTTKKAIYFNLSIFNGETVTITFSEGKIKIVSTSRGRILSQPLAGSNSDSFRLAEGDNRIATYINGTITGVLCSMIWNRIRNSLG